MKQTECGRRSKRKKKIFTQMKEKLIVALILIVWLTMASLIFGLVLFVWNGKEVEILTNIISKLESL